MEGTRLAPFATRFTTLFVVWILVTAGSTASGLSLKTPGRGFEVDSLHAAEGETIDSIVIINRNIFEPGDGSVAAFVYRMANRLHYVTRDEVIRRELLFKVGDRYSTEVVRETERNLRTRLAINDASIHTEPSDSIGHVVVYVETRDQWSLIARTEVDNDGEETDWQFGLEERNFLGYNHFISLDYFLQEFDNDYVRARFSNPRFRRQPLEVSLEYNNDPFNEVRSISLGHPFYDLTQSFSIVGSYAKRGGRREHFANSDTGAVIGAQWEDESDFFGLQSFYRWGSYHQKLRFGLGYQYVYENTTDTLRIDGLVPATVFPTDSLYHELKASAALINLDYIVERGINGFRYSEDITLEQSLEFSIARAWDPDFDNHFYNRFSLNGLYSKRLGSNIVSLEYNRSFWYKGDRNIRSTSRLTGLLLNNHLSFLTGLLRAQYLSDWRDESQANLVLGGKNGLRGYPLEFSSGDRMLVMNVEGRFFPGLDVLSVLFGGVVFIDVGRTWEADEPFTLKNMKSSIGAGLRISFERFTRAELVRIDVARTRDNQIEITFGSGQYF
jgi:outer membrane protein assembly factor BamA